MTGHTADHAPLPDVPSPVGHTTPPAAAPSTLPPATPPPPASSRRVLLIGGTSDAREIARRLEDIGVRVTLTVLTGYGAELAAADATEVLDGERDAAGLAAAAASAGAHMIVDASHPFATVVSKNARKAAELAGAGYVRFERASHLDAASEDRVILAESHEEAAAAA
ncbi:MAG: precorrin-6A/cobalt-precorrin-6A reductase, partial [Coriobacteriia bacterium]|nr:precorrin-6A/cobalt-precorrin-6A reductase [Coriobacteriia bacterium]